jgi:virginiamycin B lyase
VAVDSGHVYCGNFGINTIGRADLDGQNADQSFIPGASDPVGVAVDGG